MSEQPIEHLLVKLEVASLASLHRVTLNSQMR